MSWHVCFDNKVQKHTEDFLLELSVPGQEKTNSCMSPSSGHISNKVLCLVSAVSWKRAKTESNGKCIPQFLPLLHSRYLPHTIVYLAVWGHSCISWINSCVV